MAIATIFQPPLEVTDISEIVNIPLMPDCDIIDKSTGFGYEVRSGVMNRVPTISENAAAISTKAGQTQVTNISNALDQLNASFQNFQPLWASILNKPNFHAVATSGSYNDLINKPTIPSITPGGAITNSATNSPTDAKTDYGPIAAILGADANATNSKQNTTAANVNALAVKFNTLLATLRTNGIIST